MKNNLLFIMLTLIPFFGFSQEYEVTPYGLRDKENYDKKYLVIEVPDQLAEQLYKNVIRYINEKYKDPEEVIKGRSENEFLRFETYAPDFTYVVNIMKFNVSATYFTDIRFRDGKIRYEIINLEMKLTDKGQTKVDFQGNKWVGFPIFNKKGKIVNMQPKIGIENYFNLKVQDLKNYLLNKNNKKDDW